jgi:hypothetical protein
MSAFLILAGLAIMIVAVVRMFGLARWAHIASRKVAALVPGRRIHDHDGRCCPGR